MPKNFANTQDLVNIEEIKEDTVVAKNGALCQIVIVGGVNFSLKSETEQNLITQAYQNFLNGIDFSMQVIIHSRKINIEKYLQSLTAFEEREISPLLKNQVKEYREFVRGFVEKNAIMEKTFLIVVPFYPIALPSRESITKFIPFLKKTDKAAEEKAKQEASANFQENLAQLKQRVSQVVDGILAVGLEAQTLNTEQLIELFYNFYNPETIEKENLNLPKE